MLLTFSMGDDCPCPTDIQEELFDFHNQLQLHCGETQSVPPYQFILFYFFLNKSIFFPKYPERTIWICRLHFFIAIFRVFCNSRGDENTTADLICLSPHCLFADSLLLKHHQNIYSHSAVKLIILLTLCVCVFQIVIIFSCFFGILWLRGSSSATLSLL